MSTKLKGAVVRHNVSPPERISSAASTSEKRPRLVSIAGTTTGASPAPPLSSRALNVLKLLAPELTGETPPKGKWTPTTALLQKLTMKRLSTARNCGPQTADEIIKWAASRGVVIQPVHHAGKSLSAMWRDLELKFAAGVLTKVEVTEALERSIRRRSTKIPLAFQIILLTLISSACE
ncbi:hypothetical protein V1291_002386 [Nitrobacteraceae bacterium AZCC 1564]